MLARLKLLIVALAGVSLIACGDNDGGGGENASSQPQQCKASFGEADACGGDVDGTYTLASACSDFDWQAEFEQYCPQVTVSDISYTGTGTLILTAGTYSRQGSATVDMKIDVPNSCATSGCPSVEQLLQTEIDNNYDGGTASCAATSTGCDCDVNATVSDPEKDGTFTTSEGVVTTDDGRTFYYCATGDSLQEREFDSDAIDAYFTRVWTK